MGMTDREKVIAWLADEELYYRDRGDTHNSLMACDALALLKERASQGVVDQIRWERDTALSQLEQIGKGLGSKMDDIVALLKEQEAVEPSKDIVGNRRCPKCFTILKGKFCHKCGQAVKLE